MSEGEDTVAYPHEGSEPQFRPSADFQVTEGDRRIGLCFVGDSYVNGYGDPKALGWVSRVVARTPHDGSALTTYNLGVRGESSSDVLARWRDRDAERERARTEQSFTVPKGEIVAQDYDLSINRYKEVVHDEVDHRPPLEIIADIEALEAEIAQGMGELKAKLS